MAIKEHVLGINEFECIDTSGPTPDWDEALRQLRAELDRDYHDWPLGPSLEPGETLERFWQKHYDKGLIDFVETADCELVCGGYKRREVETADD